VTARPTALWSQYLVRNSSENKKYFVGLAPPTILSERRRRRGKIVVSVKQPKRNEVSSVLCKQNFKEDEAAATGR